MSLREDVKECTIQELLRLILPYAHSGTSGCPAPEWYEEEIFNEERLYKALGKEDARTVLAIWDRYKKVVDAIQVYRRAVGKGEPNDI